MMNRRELISGAAAATGLGSSLSTAPAAGQAGFLEVKTYRLHNSFENQSSRLAEHLQKSYAPAVAMSGAKLVGAFGTVIGPESPSVITVTHYASLAALQSSLAKLATDESYQKDLAGLGSSGKGFPYTRLESSLLRCFDGMPEPLLADANDKSSRVLELRIYESHTLATLAQKVKMFNDGEIGIFQRLGMRPVFFGETIVGPKQPNLMYMLSFDNLAARDRLWSQFGSDPEWKKISAPAELKDAEIVSNITNAILKPLPFSLIR